MNASHSWTDYQERLGHVIAYVHDHLDEALDLNRLADVAHLSSFHWHRVYCALYGETLAATVRRLRLQRASGYLANTAMPVAQLARRCGYPNAQSFARAFKGMYGMSPLQYRQAGSHTAFQHSLGTGSAEGAMPEADAKLVDLVRVVDVRCVSRVRLAGLDHHGSYMDVGRAFESTYVRLAALGQVTSTMRWMAVYLDDPFAVPERQLHSRAGLSVPEGFSIEAPLVAFELGGDQGGESGLCAVLRHQGPYATMRAAYEWLYGEWLVRSGHQVADSPVFEEYLNNPRDTAPADLLTDIYLPLLC